MQDLKLEVKSRDANTQSSLTADDVKGVVYGREVDSTPITANFQAVTKLFDAAGTNQIVSLDIEGKQSHDVLFKDVQFDPVSNRIQHFDLYAVKKGEKLQATIPVVLVGEAPAVATGSAQLSQVLESLEVECIPSKLPEQIEIDVSSLNEVGDTLQVSDVKVDPAVEILSEAEQTLVKVDEVRELEVEDETTEEPAEGEAEESEGGESGGDQSEATDEEKTSDSE